MNKFVKFILAAAMVFTMVGCSSSTTEEAGIYTPGTYTGEGKGFGGTVTATVTVDANSVKEVKLEGADETPAIGGAALEELAENATKANGGEFDGVTGATFTSEGAKAAVEAALNAAKGVEAEAAALTDGTYTASAPGYSWTGLLTADVTVKDGKLADIKITEEHDSDTGEVCLPALELLPGRILEAQSIGIDAVTGATNTSNAIFSVVSQAIKEAGGNPADFMTPSAKSDAVEKLEGYDVIVVGMGGSGILSYCAAADQGATVFGIEKTAKLGGQSATTTGPMLLGPVNDSYADVTFVDPDEVYDVWIDYVETEEKADIIKEAVYNSAEYTKYYVDNFGFEFAGMILSFVRPQWSQFWTRYVAEDGKTNIFGPNKTNQYTRAVETALSMNEKNDYVLETTAEELIVENGEVKGVKAVKADGTTLEVYGDTVILATGGYIGDEELVLEHWTKMPNTVAFMVNDGAGIKMGQSVGGATYMMGVDPMTHILQIPTLIKNDDLTPDQKAVLSALGLVKGEMSVTTSGTKLDETLPEAMIPDYTYYVLYTQDQIDGFKNEGLTDNFAMATSHFLGQGGAFEVGTPIEDIEEILAVGEEYGDVFKADSIAEMADIIGCDAATLSETLGGNDGTYYAVEIIGYTYGTVGGLDVDVNMNVLREDGTPIENLFAVGQDSMGVENIEGKVYTPWGGQAQSWTFVSGYLAGHAAAKAAE